MSNKMNNSMLLFNIGNNLFINKNLNHLICPDEISLEMLITEMESYEFNLTINKMKTKNSDDELKNLLWSSYCISVFSGDYGLAILPKIDNPETKLPAFSLVSHSEDMIFDESTMIIDIDTPPHSPRSNND
jgi:hypothetical protein